MYHKLSSLTDIHVRNFAIWLYDNPIKTLTSAFLLTCIIALGIPQLTISATTEDLFLPGDPTFANYENFRNQYGQDATAIIAIESDDLFNVEQLKKIQQLHQALEIEVPHVDEVTSLYNVTYIAGDDDRLLVEDLIETLPQTDAEIAQLKQKIDNTPLYKRLILSEDLRHTLVVIQPLSGTLINASQETTNFDEGFVEDQVQSYDVTDLNNTQKEEFVTAIQKIVKQYHAEDFYIRLTGSQVIDVEHNNSIKKDVGNMMMLAFGFLIILLLIVFRRPSGMLLPIAVVAPTLVIMFGVMGMLNLPITPASQMFPSLILAIGVADSVHFLTLYYHSNQPTNRDAVANALQRSFIPMFFTSLTTAIGFISFTQASLLPISDLGIITPLGVIVAFIFTIILLPALIAFFKIKPKRQQVKSDRFVSLMVRSGEFAYKKPKSIIVALTVLTILLIPGVMNLSFSHNLLAWLPEDNIVRQHTESVNEAMGNTVSMEVIIDTQETNGLYSPDIMNKLDRVNRVVEEIQTEYIEVNKSYSVVDTLKQINKALNENQETFYDVPQSKETIAQELLLFENSGSDDLSESIDSEFSQARISILVPWVDAIHFIPLKEKIQRELEEIFNDSAKITVTGVIDLSTQSFINVLETMADSYIMAFVSISIVMLVIFLDVRMGLISLIPNFFPIFVALAFMGYMEIPIDMFTVLMGSIALGLAVDDTVHFLHHYKHHLSQTENPILSIRKTLLSVGRAILFTTIILSGAFSIYLFAQVGTLYNLGITLFAALFSALLADIFITPSLLAVFHKQSATRNINTHA